MYELRHLGGSSRAIRANLTIGRTMSRELMLQLAEHSAQARWRDVADGISTLGEPRKLCRQVAGEPARIRCFTRAELDLAFGRTNVVHAALLAGPASQNLLARVDAWRDYCRDEHDAGTLERELSEMELSKDLASSGQRNE